MTGGHVVERPVDSVPAAISLEACVLILPLLCLIKEQPLVDGRLTGGRGEPGLGSESVTSLPA